jgi:hypothetical protein
MADQLLKGIWKHATDWLLAVVMVAGLWIARGILFVPVAIPLATPVVVSAGDGAAPAPAPAPVPVPAPPATSLVVGSRLVELSGLAFAFAGLLARLYLKDRELRRRHADDLLSAYREIAELKRDASELASMVATLRSACPNRESCPVKVLDHFAVSRPSIVPPKKNHDLEIDVDA